MNKKDTREPAAVLHVRVIPKSSLTQIKKWEEEILWVSLQAIPEKGKANKELLKFLSKKLSLPVSKITLLSGEHSRHKKVRLQGIASDELLQRMGLLAP